MRPALPYVRRLLAAGIILLAGWASPAFAQSSANVTLLGHIDHRAPRDYSDIWGYASGGVELAIIGVENGTSIVNATDPTNPVEVGFITGPTSIWRDMKTYGTYAYSVTEGGGGMKIINLANPLSPTLAGTYTGFSSCHNLFIDTDAGVAYAVGTDVGTRILSLSNPVSPSLITTFNDFYIHDIYVRDGLAFAAAIYEGYLAILDVSSLPAITVLSTIPTSGAATHNTWLTEDGRYCITTDETTGGHLHIFDVQDPSNPVLVSQWSNPTAPSSSAHNAHVKGNYAYVSWYTEGLQIIDVASPYFMDRAGWYDTYTGTGTYAGDWGAYPFTPSGTIYVSDMATGLYLLRFDPSFGTLDGTVTDASTGDPLEDVSVAIASEGREIFTVADGSYHMLLPSGSYGVVYSKFGYQPESLDVSIPIIPAVVQDVALDPLPFGALEGVVRDGGAAPIADATVSILGTPLTTTSAGDGSYSFGSVVASSYSVQAERFGYATDVKAVTINDGGVATRDFTLAPSFVAYDLETDQGWTAGIPGDDAFSGIWERVDPNGTGGGMVQPEDDHTPAPGVRCYITGQSPPGAAIGDNDVDGGVTTLLSPVLDLTSLSDPVLRYHRWYNNSAGAAPGEDVWEVHVTNDGSTWTTLESTMETNASWLPMTFHLADYLPITNHMQVRFRASDEGDGSVVEAGVDDFDVFDYTVATSVPAAPATPAGPSRIALSLTPNPFRSETALRFRLAQETPVLLDVYDTSGRRVRRLNQDVLPAGDYAFAWDGSGDDGRPAAPGMYFVRFETPRQVSAEKLVLAR